MATSVASKALPRASAKPARRLFIDLSKTYQVNYSKLVSEAEQTAKPAAGVGAHRPLDGHLGGGDNNQVLPTDTLRGLHDTNRAAGHLQSVIQKFESMYEVQWDSDEEASPSTMQTEGRFLSARDVHVDRKKGGDMYYDTDDDFIDDEELDTFCATDDHVRTKHTGFFIQKGEVAVVEGEVPVLPTRYKSPGKPALKTKSLNAEPKLKANSGKSIASSKALALKKKALKHKSVKSTQPGVVQALKNTAKEGIAAVAAAAGAAAAGAAPVAKSSPAPKMSKSSDGSHKTHAVEGLSAGGNKLMVSGGPSKSFFGKHMQQGLSPAQKSNNPGSSSASDITAGSQNASGKRSTYTASLAVEAAISALQAKVRHLPPPPELTTEQLEGQTAVRKRLPESLNDDLKTVSVLLAKEAGCIPSHILQVLMDFLEPWSQESTVRRKMKEFIQEFKEKKMDAKAQQLKVQASKKRKAQQQEAQQAACGPQETVSAPIQVANLERTGSGTNSSQAYSASPQLEEAIQALRTKVKDLAPPELATVQSEGQQVRKRFPDELNKDLAQVSRILANEVGCVPTSVVQVLMEFLEPWAQDATLRRKLKEHIAEHSHKKDEELMKKRKTMLKKEIRRVLDARVQKDEADAQHTTDSDNHLKATTGQTVKWSKRVEELVHGIVSLASKMDPATGQKQAKKELCTFFPDGQIQMKDLTEMYHKVNRRAQRVEAKPAFSAGSKLTSPRPSLTPKKSKHPPGGAEASAPTLASSTAKSPVANAPSLSANIGTANLGSMLTTNIATSHKTVAAKTVAAKQPAPKPSLSTPLSLPPAVKPTKKPAPRPVGLKPAPKPPTYILPPSS